MDTDQQAGRRMEAIDKETRRWLHDFPAFKRRKAERPGDVTIAFLQAYMAERLYDYYFIQRNYSHLVPLLQYYADSFGQVEGVARLIRDAGESLKAD